MNQFTHSLIAMIILIIIFNVFLKRYFYGTKEDKKRWGKIIGRFF